MADIQNYSFIKYKDEYQNHKWTIEFRIFISFIWSRSELWNCNNNNVFTKKRKFAWLDFVDYTWTLQINPMETLTTKTMAILETSKKAMVLNEKFPKLWKILDIPESAFVVIILVKESLTSSSRANIISPFWPPENNKKIMSLFN